MIKSTNIKSVSGNCDRILLASSSENPTMQYVIDVLSEEQKSWLINLPFSIQTDDFYFCHASPENDELYMLNDITPNGVTLKQTEEIMKLVKDIPQNIIFCGHSHFPTIVYLLITKSLLIQAVSVCLLMKKLNHSVIRWNPVHHLRIIQL